MGNVIVLIVGIAGLVALLWLAISMHFDTQPFSFPHYPPPPSPVKPFSVAKYYDRIINTGLSIQEKQKPADRIIVLWWGLDGLRLNEDGSIEWIKREQPKPVNQNVFYQPCQTYLPTTFPAYNYPMPMYSYGFFAAMQSPQIQIPQYNMCQNMQSTIMSLQLQQAQQIQNAVITANLKECCCVPKC